MDRWIATHGPAVLLSILLLSFAWSLLLPLYTDEVAWRFLLSRVLQDGGVDRWVGETCGANILATPPAFMRPLRWTSSLLTAAFPDPRWVRAAGVSTAAASVLLMRRVITIGEPDAERRSALHALSFLMLGLGVLPPLLTMSRPEQPIWAGLLGAILIALTSARRPAAARRAWPPIAIAAIALLVMGYHMKALFYLPVFIVCAWIAGADRRTNWMRGIAILVMLGAALIAYGYWASRFQCPDDAVLRAKLDQENLSSLMIRSDGGDRLRLVPQIALNLLPIQYFATALPSRLFMSDWLPPVIAPPLVLSVWRTAIFLAWAAVLLLGVAAARSVGRAGRFHRPAALIAVALVIGLVAWGAPQMRKNAYEGMIYLPALLLAVGLLLSVSTIEARVVRRYVAVLFFPFLLSQAALALNLTPRLIAAQRHIGSLPDHRYSIPVWTFAEYRQRAVAAAAKCGISPRAANRRLLIDDASYFVFADSYRPLHYTGVTEYWTGKVTDAASYMRQMRSSGAVLACRYLEGEPLSLKLAIATGDICCIPPRP